MILLVNLFNLIKIQFFISLEWNFISLLIIITYEIFLIIFHTIIYYFQDETNGIEPQFAKSMFNLTNISIFNSLSGEKFSLFINV